MKPGNRYIIVNIDEPYAEEIYEVLKRGQEDKGEWPEGDISFEEWVRETFGGYDDTSFWTCEWCGTINSSDQEYCPCEFEGFEEDERGGL